MNFEQSLAFVLGQKELELIKSNEQIRILKEELDSLKKVEEIKEQP